MGISQPAKSQKLTDKRIIRFTLLLAFGLTLSLSAMAQSGSVGIGTKTPKSEALLDIDSREKGLLIPRLDDTDVAALTAKILVGGAATNADYNGMLIYNTSKSAFNFWKDNKWMDLGVSGSGGSGGGGSGGGSTGSILIPYLTMEERDELLEPDATSLEDIGTLVYVTDDQNLYIWKGSNWDLVVKEAGGGSSDQDIIFPNLTTQERDDLLTPGVASFDERGLVIFNSDDKKLNLWSGDSWDVVGGGSGAGTPGADGADGADGKSAYELWLEDPANAGKPIADFLTSIKGADGAAGTNGTNGQSAYELWVADPANTGKPLADFLTSLIGPAGTAGTNGTNGTPGSKWFVGSADPDDATGVDGDLYFKDGTNEIFVKTGGTWGTAVSTINPTNSWSMSGNTGTTPPLSGDPTTYLGTADSQDFIIGTNAKERIRVKSGGNVGIGTENAGAKLHVAGDVIIGALGNPINKVLKTSITRNIPSIAAGAQRIETFSLANCSLNSIVTVSPESALPAGLIISYARVSVAAIGAIPGTVEVAFWNANAVPVAPATSSVDPASMKFNIMAVE
jgi:hypothetical protein